MSARLKRIEATSKMDRKTHTLDAKLITKNKHTRERAHGFLRLFSPIATALRAMLCTAVAVTADITETAANTNSGSDVITCPSYPV